HDDAPESTRIPPRTRFAGGGFARPGVGGGADIAGGFPLLRDKGPDPQCGCDISAALDRGHSLSSLRSARRIARLLGRPLSDQYGVFGKGCGLVAARLLVLFSLWPSFGGAIAKGCLARLSSSDLGHYPARHPRRGSDWEHGRRAIAE